MNIHFLKVLLVKTRAILILKNRFSLSVICLMRLFSITERLAAVRHACAAMQTLPVLSFMANLEYPTANVI